MEMQDLTGRFVTISFNKGWVLVIAKKTGRVEKMWLASDPEWTRRQLAWLFMLSPRIKPSEVDSHSAAYATEMLRDIRDQAAQLAHREMFHKHFWINPADCDPLDLDEDWVDEYYKRFRPIRYELQSQLIQDQAAFSFAAITAAFTVSNAH